MNILRHKIDILFFTMYNLPYISILRGAPPILHNIYLVVNFSRPDACQ